MRDSMRHACKQRCATTHRGRSHPVSREEAARDGHDTGDANGGVQERRVVAHAGDRDALGLFYAHLPRQEQPSRLITQFKLAKQTTR